jgi:two-component system, OmpR family, KDP operon response regulator KdpE
LLKKILLVDDDAAQLRMMSSSLNANGFKPLQANNGHEAVRIVTSDKPDLVILDMMMPELDGCETCRLIREGSDVPVIILTGQCKTEADIVRGLECGADEYIYKPVGNRELLARIKAVLRRSEKIPTGNIPKKVFFSNDYLTVDVPERRVVVNGERLKLTPREFRLLALLVENADRILSHKQVLEQVWGYEYVDDVDYVRIYISHLRQKIEPEPSDPRYILTEPGVGYYFCSTNKVSGLKPEIADIRSAMF